MAREVFSSLSREAGFILFCAIAINEGRHQSAKMNAEKLKDSKVPLARALVGRVLGETGEMEKALQNFAEAMRLAEGKKSSTSRYIVEYCKCYIFQWENQRELKEQVIRALSIKPPAYVLECLPLFDDADIFD